MLEIAEREALEANVVASVISFGRIDTGGFATARRCFSAFGASGCTNVERRSASTGLGGKYSQEGGLLREELSLRGIPWAWSRNLNWDGVRLARCPAAGPRGSGCRTKLCAATPGSLGCGPPSARHRRWQNGLNRPVLKHGPRSLTYVRVLR